MSTIADPDQRIVPPRVSHACSSRGLVGDVDRVDVTHGADDHWR